MRASVFMAQDGFARLRRRIAEIEGRPVGLNRDGEGANPEEAIGISSRPDGAARQSLAPRRGASILSFGIPDLDRLLAGGLRRNALHEIRCETMRVAGAATGFAAALLARLGGEDDRPVLWIVEARAAGEAGLPYGPGLDRFGLDSRRLVIVRVKKADEALWVFEEGLRCRGLAAVLAEIKGHPHRLDLTASRRLALRAREGGVMGLLLRQAGEAEPGAAATRWLVSPRPSAPLDDFEPGIGRPVWRLALERNRHGATGAFDLEWDHGRNLFASADPSFPALSLPRLSLPPDRPDHPAPSGAVVAFRRAS
jgi:protein ImuA